VTRATTNDMDITKNAPGAQIVRFEVDATLITADVTWQVDIISSQSAVLGGINAKRTAKPRELKFTQAETNLGIAIPKGEKSLQDWLNGWVKTNFANGTLRDLLRKFHNRDLPDDLTSR
jgi:polar amino acid transport system substrate-binding protein